MRRFVVDMVTDVDFKRDPMVMSAESREGALDSYMHAKMKKFGDKITVAQMTSLTGEYIVYELDEGTKFDVDTSPKLNKRQSGG